ncbi:MAG: Gfo/Idh/MocA family protein [Salibacteraceae bacterium]
MRVLIIGLGSIAKKHIDALNSLRKDITYLALRSSKNSEPYKNVQNIYDLAEIKEALDFCIISNPTHLHFDAINQAIDLNIPLFIEKPSLMTLDKADVLLDKIKTNNTLTHIAFNLRFHPVLNFLKKHLSEKKVLEANVYCGSYLPNWRPGVDYRKVYSAIAEMGGGVHLDLIHEIDYSTWLFGFPENTSSIRKNISDLEISSFDYANYQLEYPNKAVSITLNYYRKEAKRLLEIITKTGVIYADLLTQKVWNDKEEVLFQSNVPILDTYVKQMEYFLKLISSGKQSFSTFENSLENLKICLK